MSYDCLPNTFKFLYVSLPVKASQAFNEEKGKKVQNYFIEILKEKKKKETKTRQHVKEFRMAVPLERENTLTGEAEQGSLWKSCKCFYLDGSAVSVYVCEDLLCLQLRFKCFAIFMLYPHKIFL